jgi:hypothetical protein
MEAAFREQPSTEGLRNPDLQQYNRAVLPGQLLCNRVQIEYRNLSHEFYSTKELPAYSGDFALLTVTKTSVSFVFSLYLSPQSQ